MLKMVLSFSMYFEIDNHDAKIERDSLRGKDTRGYNI